MIYNGVCFLKLIMDDNNVIAFSVSWYCSWLFWTIWYHFVFYNCLKNSRTCAQVCL